VAGAIRSGARCRQQQWGPNKHHDDQKRGTVPQQPPGRLQRTIAFRDNCRIGTIARRARTTFGKPGTQAQRSA